MVSLILKRLSLTEDRKPIFILTENKEEVYNKVIKLKIKVAIGVAGQTVCIMNDKDLQAMV